MSNSEKKDTQDLNEILLHDIPMQIYKECVRLNIGFEQNLIMELDDIFFLESDSNERSAKIKEILEKQENKKQTEQEITYL